MFTSTGILKYHVNPYKLIVEVDQGISDYYRSTIPKYFKTNKQLYPAHISVVRKEIPPNLDAWNKYQDKEIEFYYEHYVYSDNTYWWINIFCNELEFIRQELGLPIASGITRSPDGKHKFHMTIGNTKGLQ
jgi:hypothetical protein